MKDLIDKLSAEKKRASKKHRTSISLDYRNFSEFKKLCASKGVTASAVIDAWIAETLKAGS